MKILNGFSVFFKKSIAYFFKICFLIIVEGDQPSTATTKAPRSGGGYRHGGMNIENFILSHTRRQGGGSVYT